MRTDLIHVSTAHALRTDLICVNLSTAHAMRTDALQVSTAHPMCTDLIYGVYVSTVHAMHT